MNLLIFVSSKVSLECSILCLHIYYIFFSKLYIFMFSPIFEIILEIEFQCSYDFYLQGFSWILFFIVIWSFEKFVKTRLYVWTYKNKYLIWNPLPTLYTQYLFGLKYDRQLTACQHHGPKIDPTYFRRCKMGWVPFFICFFPRKLQIKYLMLQQNFMVSKSNLKLY